MGGAAGTDLRWRRRGGCEHRRWPRLHRRRLRRRRGAQLNRGTGRRGRRRRWRCRLRHRSLRNLGARPIARRVFVRGHLVRGLRRRRRSVPALVRRSVRGGRGAVTGRLDAKDEVTDVDLVALADDGRLRDLAAVDEGAVGALEIGDDETAVSIKQAGVALGDVSLREHEIIALHTADVDLRSGRRSPRRSAPPFSLITIENMVLRPRLPSASKGMWMARHPNQKNAPFRLAPPMHVGLRPAFARGQDTHKLFLAARETGHRNPWRPCVLTFAPNPNYVPPARRGQRTLSWCAGFFRSAVSLWILRPWVGLARAQTTSVGGRVAPHLPGAIEKASDGSTSSPRLPAPSRNLDGLLKWRS